MRTKGEIRKKLKELEENKEEITKAAYTEQKRIGLHGEIKRFKVGSWRRMREGIENDA